MQKYRKRRPVVNQNISGLILYEGETEEHYFKGFIRSDKNKRFFASIDIEIYKPKNHSPLGLVDEAKSRIKEAKQKKIPYKFAWVIFDKDGHVDIPQAFNDARTYNPEIKIAFTAKCFEIFILLHFEKTSYSFKDCAEVIKAVKKHIPNYEKAQDTLYDSTKHMLPIAKDNCIWLFDQYKDDINSGIRTYNLSSYCNVNELIEELENVIANKSN